LLKLSQTGIGHSKSNQSSGPRSRMMLGNDPVTTSLSSAQRELRLVVTARTRGNSKLDELVIEPRPDDPSAAQLIARARDDDHQPAIWLVGGEPTLRADLPQLVAGMRTATSQSLGLCTDGLALSDQAALQPLLCPEEGPRQLGLTRVRISLHCARADAHDWLVGQTGAARRAIRALRLCSAAGLGVEVDAVVTRPTLPYLGELVKLCAHLGVETVHLRQLLPRGPAAAELHMLAPRLSQLEQSLGEASVAAARGGGQLILHGFPVCAIGQLTHH